MFRRADWVHSKKGRGGGLEDSSSSESESDDETVHSSSQDVEEDEDSSEDDDLDDEELDGDSLEDDEEDEEEDDDEDIDDEGGIEEEDESDEEVLDMSATKQSDAWYEAGKEGKVVKGRALMCVPCARTKKVLLLNSIMLYRHVTSGQHRKVMKRVDEGDVLFRFADTYTKKGLVAGGETHQERLERIKAQVGIGAANSSKKKKKKKKSTKKPTSKKVSKDEEKNPDTPMGKAAEGKGPKKRKTRPGKRQRQELKEARAKQSTE